MDKITNKENKKSYVGCTIKSIGDRFREHVSRCKKTQTKFCSALKKYGQDGFILEQIDSCDNTTRMYELEKFYIKEYNTYNKGYNLTFMVKIQRNKKKKEENLLKIIGLM